MKIDGMVHCFFEQSGTFKREFDKLGIHAEDYDIQNEYEQTDHVMDLFAEIDKAYAGRQSLFDHIGRNDLVMAFFPCIYFSCMSQANMSFTAKNYRKKSLKETTDLILQRSANRERFLSLLIRLISTCKERGIRLVVENPWSGQTFLKNGFVMKPTIVDMDRTRRGDVYKKPTAYFFINCKPTSGHSFTPPPYRKTIVKDKPGKKAGICSEERSTITSAYARNFICDFIIGKEQSNTERTLFDLLEN